MRKPEQTREDRATRIAAEVISAEYNQHVMPPEYLSPEDWEHEGRAVVKALDQRGMLTEPKKDEQPVYRLVVELPADLPQELREKFDVAVADAVYATEPKDRKDWDAFMYGGFGITWRFDSE